MKRRISLTPGTIEALKEGKLLDPLTPGLCTEINAKGRAVWHYRRRIVGTGVTFKRTLGLFPAYSIADARAWAAKFNELLDAGLDPRVVERETMDRETLTVAKAHDCYMLAVREGRASRAKRRNKASTIADKEELYRHEIGPALGAKLIFDISEADLTRLVLKTGKRAKVRANRLATELKVFFGWASSLRGSEIGLPSNPSARLSDLKFPEAPRKRTLSLEEIGWFLRALVSEPRLYQRGMILWLLTAARLTEVIHARSCEFNNGIWTIPEDRVKNSRPHRISLGPWGQSLMRCNSEWVFPSDRIDGPRVAYGWYQARNRVLVSMSRIAGRQIENWTPHDMRRTARSNTKRLKVDFETAEAMLNHAKTGLERTYDRYAFEEEKRDWFWRWEKEVIRIATEAGVADALGVPGDTMEGIIRPLRTAWARRHPTRARTIQSRRARRRG